MAAQRSDKRRGAIIPPFTVHLKPDGKTKENLFEARRRTE
jgi:hypothetical protein